MSAVSALSERLDKVERPSSLPSSYGSSGYDSFDDASSRTSSRGSFVADDSYVGITLPNPHWNAAALSRDADGRPRRISMYGNKAHDQLAAGRHEGGGTLGLALGYLEPLALFMHSLVAHSEALVDNILDGEIASERDLVSALAEARNTTRECYNMVNQFRFLVVNKARALRPSSSDYDKAEAKYLELSLIHI